MRKEIFVGNAVMCVENSDKNGPTASVYQFEGDKYTKIAVRRLQTGDLRKSRSLSPRWWTFTA